jgi:choline dehydrogenase-like flavoprotein
VFTPRGWVGDVAWPIDRAALDPWYDRAASLLDLDAALLDDAAVWQRLGLALPEATDAVQPFISRWVREPNLARLFSDAIASEPNLTVVHDAPVVALAGQQDAVAGVMLPGGRLVSAPQVVLANGTIEIARLLQLPYADASAPPWHASPWLGRGFMDHLDCHAGRIVPLDHGRFHAAFDNVYLDGRKYSPRLKLSEAAQRSEALLGSGAYIDFASSMDEHLANLKILVRGLSRGRFGQSLAALPGSLAAMRFAVPMALRYLRHHRMYNLADRGIGLRLTTEQRPLAESRVTLRSERDQLGMPLVDVDWRADDATFETMAFFAEHIAQYLAGQGLATVTLDPRLLARDPAFFAAADDANHQMGTARMSAGIETGVVDANLKVHGTRNLHVAGAAVHPGTGFANPTFTAIALGLRLAERLGHG